MFKFSVPTIGEDKEGKTIGYVYSDATPTGIFTLSDACRTGVVEAIKELKLLGIKSAMLTGDSHASAMHTQDQVHLALLNLYNLIIMCKKSSKYDCKIPEYANKAAKNISCAARAYSRGCSCRTFT